MWKRYQVQGYYYYVPTQLCQLRLKMKRFLKKLKTFLSLTQECHSVLEMIIYSKICCDNLSHSLCYYILSCHMSIQLIHIRKVKDLHIGSVCKTEETVTKTRGLANRQCIK